MKCIEALIGILNQAEEEEREKFIHMMVTLEGS